MLAAESAMLPDDEIEALVRESGPTLTVAGECASVSCDRGTSPLGGESAIAALARALSTSTTITDLHVPGNGISAEGASVLSAAMQRSGGAKLRVLDLSYNQIGNAGVYAISLAATTLEELHVSSNSLDDSSATALASALKTSTTLRFVCIVNNGFTAVGVAELAASVACARALKQLDMGFNQIGDEGAEAVASALIHVPMLEQLNVEYSDIGERGVKAIAGSLASNTTLTWLSLDGSVVNAAAAVEMGHALRRNTTLETLHLCDAQIGPDSAVALGDALAENQGLVRIFLARNNVGDAGARHIGTMLPACNTLVGISLAMNCISASGMVALFEGLTQSQLAEMNVSNNHLGDEGASSLVEFWSQGRGAINLCDNRIGPSGLCTIADAIESGDNAFVYLLLDGNSGLLATGDWSMEFPEHDTRPEVKAARRIQETIKRRKLERVHIPALIRSMTADTESFYNTLLHQRTRALHRCKVALVGSGRAGKTTLLRRLTRQVFSATEASTCGISECEVDVTTWRPGGSGDGGHSEYYQVRPLLDLK